MLEGPVLVTGSSRGIGRAFADWLSERTASSSSSDPGGQAAIEVVRHASARQEGERGGPHVLEVADFTSEADVDELVQRLEARYPGGVAGLAHFASSPLDTAGTASGTDEALKVIDVHLKALVHLVGRLLPLMRRHGGPCRIMTVSSGAALMSPSSWSLPSGQQLGMYSLVKGFVEQYTEALAFELRSTNVTVCGARIEGTFQTDLHDLTRSAMAQPVSDILPALADVWELPDKEAHGRIVPARPKQRPRAGQISGGSVMGASVDCRFALRAAVAGLSDYPPNGKPDAYATLVKALGLPEKSICWFHGSSDAIMRCATARLGCPPRLGASSKPDVAPVAVQKPTWTNAENLLKGGGAREITGVDYGNPWIEEARDAGFWEGLEAKLRGPSPPALVYLVHPHFPTGYNAEDFRTRLASAVEAGPRSTLFVVDQCYLGFVDGEEARRDARDLEQMAMGGDQVVLVRSLSKVEGLAGVRLGYTVASTTTTRHLADGLPFAGSLYISEVDLAAGVAALLSPDVEERRAEVIGFYAEERAWLSKELEALGLEVTRSVGPFACLRGPEKALREAAKEGAQVMVYECPTGARLSADAPFGATPMASAVFLVAERAANEYMVQVLRRRLKEGEGGFRLPWMSL